MTVADVMRELLADPETKCVDCDHHAERHAGLTGPCAQCWEDMEIPLCERFHPSAAVRARLLEEATQ